jgi:hypothetical protein
VIDILLVAIAAFIGYMFRDIRTLKNRVKEMQKEPEIGATTGSYGVINELNSTNQDGDVGIVEPKTPAQLEFEEGERLKLANGLHPRW